MRPPPILAAFILLAMADVAVADYVAGLDPNGDNYLSLRSGPGSQFGEIARMAPDTVVRVVGRSGSWRRVRLEDGTKGWAFGKYISPGLPPGMEESTAAAGPEQAPAPPADAVEAGDYDMAPIGGDAALASPPEPQTEAQPDIPFDVDGVVSDISRGLDGGD